ncbi:MAG: VanW family protein, partial [Thermomicrobiales bacterium]
MVQRLPATTTTDVSSQPFGYAGRILNLMHEARTAVLDRVRSFSPARISAEAEAVTGDGDDSVSVPRDRSRFSVGMTRFAIVVSTLLLVAAVGLFVFRMAYGERIYPAVSVGDVPVGGLSMGAAEDRLEQRAADLERDVIVFTYKGKTWSPTLAELGVDVDINASLAEAHQLGRTGDTSARLQFTRDLLSDDQVVPLRTRISQSKLNSWLDKADQKIDNRAVNAGIVFEGTMPKIIAGTNGIVVDRKQASAQILTALQHLEFSKVALPTTVEQPKIAAADLQQHYEEIADAVKKPIVVTFGNESWNVDPKDLMSHITIETTMSGGKPNVHMALDVETLTPYLNERFAQLVNHKPVNAEVAWSSAHGLTATVPSIDGATLKPRRFAETLSENFLSGKPVAIPVVVTKPEVDSNNLNALGIENRISRGDSNFAGGDEARDNNIYVGAELASGTLIRPGDDYSFNGAIGAITEDKGYVVSNVIFGETPGVDIGGGICQVSTTVFRAALLGGVPITEWHPHSFRLSNYEYDGWDPGFDASILQSEGDPSTWGDFKFTNDTGGWLLVQTWTDFPHLIVEIYGKKMDRIVDVSEFWMSTNLKGALTTGFVRTVLDNKGDVEYER